MGIKISVSNMSLRPGKVAPGQWEEHGRSFENMDWPEQVDIASMLYTGRSITTWHSNNWRHGDNFILGQHLALEFDTEDERSTLDTLKADPFIATYGGFIYTTASHRPEAPRARVLFFLDTPIHQAKNYMAAQRALLWLYPHADQKCKDPCRVYFGSYSADFALLGNELPLSKAKELISRHSEFVSNDVALRKSSAQITPVSQAEAARMLQRIPPHGIDYDEWVSVLMGLHSEFGADALPLAESWADGYPGEVESKFRSFRNSGNAVGKVTMGTVVAIAKRFGYERGSL
jgi:hypothetical protein